MDISAREKIILDELIDRNEEVTIKELSEKIAVSPRTIHRDLNTLEKLLRAYNLELIRKTGVGIQIVGVETDKEILKQKLNTFSSREYTLDERQTMILCTLYESSEPVKLFALANEIGVAIATISADLLKLEEQLKPFKLLIVKKRGYGIEISGSEKAKRRAMSYVIAKTLKEDELFSFTKERIQKKSGNQENPISKRLLHLVDREKILIIEDVMQQLNRVLPFPITDNAYVGLIVHLTLAIERIMLGENIQMDTVYLEQLTKEPEYHIAQEIIAKLSARFQIEIPKAEIGYITMHLQGAKLRHNEGQLLEASNLETFIHAKKLIQCMEDATGEDLMDNAPLLEGLVTHLKPAIYRIRQDMGITNPLLKSIRKDYEELFQIVKNAVGKVFPELQIPNEEIGYLVMHFGSVLLGVKGEKDLKAYIVCSSGIGTSKMLVSRLQREIPEIAEIANVSLFELNELQISDRDLVISTIYLQDFTKEYLIVSPFMTEEEIKQVQLYARRQKLIKKPVTLVNHSNSTIEEITNRMKSIHLYTGTVAELLSGFQHSSQKEHMSVEKYIRVACNQLEKKNIIKDAEIVADALFAREAIGGIGIPETKLALFHTRHEQILKPSFTIQTLVDPIVMKAMDGTDSEVRHLLLLLAPHSYHEQGLEVLSYISSLIIEDEKSIELFESSPGTHIHSYLAQKFEQFINEKIK
ncbi:BglG family transcription antiterminator [Sporosarcina sp. E16_8]|uniref:BglG family transcription antiterminator n=1 Tax=Sporosarcina sp. E16_8 TaxID=2789295 RepID=UPI001A91CEA9|nr:BglG family transcription antiterminator [Sporosarcina sp. E16_8]MBO0587384.1 BglG family transcription antiterminator [Sporosarcina sp. E16_8]